MRGILGGREENGIDIYRSKPGTMPACVKFLKPLSAKRETHTPALFMDDEVTQPQGHSTSGSHERYKTPERLEWEREWDCIRKFKEWILKIRWLTRRKTFTRLRMRPRTWSGRAATAPGKNIPPRSSPGKTHLRWQLICWPRFRKSSRNRRTGSNPDRQPRTGSSRYHVLPSRPLIQAGGRTQAAKLVNITRSCSMKNKRLYNSHLYNEAPQRAAGTGS